MTTLKDYANRIQHWLIRDLLKISLKYYITMKIVMIKQDKDGSKQYHIGGFNGGGSNLIHSSGTHQNSVLFYFYFWHKCFWTGQRPCLHRVVLPLSVQLFQVLGQFSPLDIGTCSYLDQLSNGPYQKHHQQRWSLGIFRWQIGKHFSLIWFILLFLFFHSFFLIIYFYFCFLYNFIFTIF